MKKPKKHQGATAALQKEASLHLLPDPTNSELELNPACIPLPKNPALHKL